MSNVIATMANALIEFILSLIRDPEAAAEFEADPEGALEARGLGNVGYNDLCAALPVVYDNPQVLVHSEPGMLMRPPADPGGVSPTQVIQQLHELITNTSYVTNNSTVLDQSVNQNLWAEGDILQIFDNEAIVASGQGSTAAGRDVVDDDSTDSSTTVTVGGDAVVDSTVDTDTAVGSNNETTVTGPFTDGSAPVTGGEAAPVAAQPSEGESTTDVVVDQPADAPAPTAEAPAQPEAPADHAAPEPAAEGPAPAETAAAEPVAEEPPAEQEQPVADEPIALATVDDAPDPYAAADESTALSEPIAFEETTTDSEY
ncbi:IniB N-terminal domain-containing protein [Microbacterium sp. EYE_5]|uniref:IniB N-terminal domain-containing protein n=1 Tax=unclassified Microbacterium TaxID=2609290 RepID=UPI0020059A41|nr:MULTISPECIES: IniB N-terminal domain-containing protein [unclassified Microbacterium]MCK6079004.1 IniB N-terminal domain-containing protein [Microbacterium sp. EYE_382]MCK6084274.1 IniB N-terminal domain-containing protein [Microbacterium sp. EYE_384]MCK6123497.1 IniB N-terminal domain-containing protein [Microbacterium sp. EYE_80]MCK6125038.1 IniB N-terminal domain-containing protein [Microbacterium sp. EYE_79]MCK6142868.1 IniB N-terminal domain-containing protein [Microbacterium sp. EYE_3